MKSEPTIYSVKQTCFNCGFRDKKFVSLERGKERKCPLCLLEGKFIAQFISYEFCGKIK